MDKSALVARAERLAELHAAGRPLVLPTIWDAWSARTAAGSGFAALTIGSHPLADSRGAEDHEGQSLDEVVHAGRAIVDSVGCRSRSIWNRVMGRRRINSSRHCWRPAESG